MKKKHIIIIASAAMILLVGGLLQGCLSGQLKEDTVIGGADGPTEIFLAGKLGGEDMGEYQSITMEEAKQIFSEKGDYTILDVRRADEFAAGHIPGAIHVANEEIGTEMPEELPNLDAVIYVYCRSGRRSKEASEKLAAIGYTNIIECGGILDWTGEIEQ